MSNPATSSNIKLLFDVFHTLFLTVMLKLKLELLDLTNSFIDLASFESAFIKWMSYVYIEFSLNFVNINPILALGISTPRIIYAREN